MQFVLGEPERDRARVLQLVTLFTSNRWLRSHPIYGVRDDDRALAGVVTLTPPGDHETPVDLPPLLDRLWSELGGESRTRYETLRTAWQQTEPAGVRWHLNMIGVADAARGAGFGSRLLRHAIAVADADPAADGIDLTTEHARNVPFYESHGFQVVDSVRITNQFQTWILIRDRDRSRLPGLPVDHR